MYDEPLNGMSTSESEEESDEEMVVQDWRIQRCIRESYLESIKVTIRYCFYGIICTLMLQSADDELNEVITSLHGAAPVKIIEKKQGELTETHYIYIILWKD